MLVYVIGSCIQRNQAKVRCWQGLVDKAECEGRKGQVIPMIYMVDGVRLGNLWRAYHMVSIFTLSQCLSILMLRSLQFVFSIRLDSMQTSRESHRLSANFWHAHLKELMLVVSGYCLLSLSLLCRPCVSMQSDIIPFSLYKDEYIRKPSVSCTDWLVACPRLPAF